MRKIGLLLCLVLGARAGDDQAVVHFYAVADLRAAGDAWWAATTTRVRAAGVDVKLVDGNLVVTAPPAVQERVARELMAVREACGTFVRIQVRHVRVEGGLGVATVPADRLDAVLAEKRAEVLSAPTVSGRNGQPLSIEVFRDVSYVSDFTMTIGRQGEVTVEPVVSVLKAGFAAQLRPFVGRATLLAAHVSVTDVRAEMPAAELPFPLPAPLEVQVPEVTTRSASRLLECRPDAYTVLDLGGSEALLLRATPYRECVGPGFLGQEVPLK